MPRPARSRTPVARGVAAEHRMGLFADFRRQAFGLRPSSTVSAACLPSAVCRSPSSAPSQARGKSGSHWTKGATGRDFITVRVASATAVNAPRLARPLLRADVGQSWRYRNHRSSCPDTGFQEQHAHQTRDTRVRRSVGSHGQSARRARRSDDHHVPGFFEYERAHDQRKRDDPNDGRRRRPATHAVGRVCRR